MIKTLSKKEEEIILNRKDEIKNMFIKDSEHLLYKQDIKEDILIYFEKFENDYLTDADTKDEILIRKKNINELILILNMIEQNINRILIPKDL